MPDEEGMEENDLNIGDGDSEDEEGNKNDDLDIDDIWAGVGGLPWDS